MRNLSGLGAAEIEARIDDLLARMSLEEKIGQMSARGWGPEFDETLVAEGRVGMVSTVEEPETMARLQRLARGSRLGIPLMFARDALHGYRTLAPVPLGLAGTFARRIIASGRRLTPLRAAPAGEEAPQAPSPEGATVPPKSAGGGPYVNAASFDWLGVPADG